MTLVAGTPHHSLGVDRYAAAVAGRAWLALWGKAQPFPDSTFGAHPLVCHMIDVAVVCEHLVDRVLSPGARDRFLRAWGCEPDVARAWLPTVVALHDFGKATPAFQAKSRELTTFLRELGFDINPPQSSRDHGTIGPYFLAPVLEGWGFPPQAAYRIARSVCAHHGSFPPDDEVPDDFSDDPRQSISRHERGANPCWNSAREELLHALGQVFPRPAVAPHPLEDGPQAWAFYSMLAGLTSVADWVGSVALHFTYEVPEDVVTYLPQARARAEAAIRETGLRGALAAPLRSFSETFGRTPRPLQELAEKVGRTAEQPFLFLAEAPMGEGKTETAFYLARALEARGLHAGMYVALPTQATANQMFARLVDYLEQTSEERTSAILVHGEASLNTRMRQLVRDIHGRREDQGVACEAWFLGKKRSLLAAYGAGTIDQALLSVLRTKHAFVRQFGLAGKTVVLDEVHAYDAYTSQLLERLVAWLGAHGSSVVLLSATLPASRRRRLLGAYLGKKAIDLEDTTYPRVSVAHADSVTVSPIPSGRPIQALQLEWLSDEPADDCSNLVAELSRSIHQGGCAAVLRNTVDRAQKTYVVLRRALTAGLLPADTELLLLHARFPAGDRGRIEERLIGALAPHSRRPSRMVVVGTQVLEQSLDVDFDMMITDLAPVDLVLQRAGRVHRHSLPNRPPALQQPRLIIVRPPDDAMTCSFKHVAPVYSDYVLRKTLLELEKLDTVRLPTDIEPLIESVYSDEPPQDGQLLEDWEELAANQQSEELLARSRAWPLPTVPDDPFAEFRVPFREEDPDLAHALRAETRLGDESISVVCLFGSQQESFLDAGHQHPIRLTGELRRSDIEALAQRSVKLSRRDVVRALKEQCPPSSFSEVSVLANRRALFFTPNSPIALGRTLVEIDSELGIIFRTQDTNFAGDDQDAL